MKVLVEIRIFMNLQRGFSLAFQDEFLYEIYGRISK